MAPELYQTSFALVSSFFFFLLFIFETSVTVKSPRLASGAPSSCLGLLVCTTTRHPFLVIPGLWGRGHQTESSYEFILLFAFVFFLFKTLRMGWRDGG